ncbi:leucine carboxyl methyltransferase 1-like [Haliotis cracherodii]|uniref:leucine carboxyl methyltransferase 1-like n=1 Tax=Haliotis rufescens TaxID=6454 RepID=UPI001EB07E4C|nr:leucine carboxyl methyltransferase 1-like [Haliotis rufescens]
MACEDAVIATNDDAAQCKRFAVEKGYWTDPYISQIIPKGFSTHAPEINRGYFARVRSIQILMEKFLKSTQCNCQIVNLGAGFDTTYWKLKDAALSPKSFVEVDFPPVTSRKCHFIKTKKALIEKISSEDDEIMVSKTEMHAADYHIVAANLKNIPELEKKLVTECKLDKDLPTLFLAECVLVYIETERSQHLIRWISDTFNTAFFINYEQVNMTDRFGQVMMDNLKTRDCYLHGVSACASLDTQMKRFTSNGWTSADSLEISTVYNCLPQAEIQRIERIEMMDERELMHQLFSHYCLTWAYRDLKDVGLAQIGLT